MKCQECLGLAMSSDLASPSHVIGKGSGREEGREPRGGGQPGWAGAACPGPGGTPGSGAGRACRAAAPAVPSHWVPAVPAELSQVEITQTYLAKQADEISLQQADVVLVLGGEDGECQPAGGLRLGKAELWWGEGFMIPVHWDFSNFPKLPGSPGRWQGPCRWLALWPSR